ncbi:MAG: hypothetical protein HFH08_05810 [Bacilli bacterium]|nr:hypothetical protein [Bacilli bacterium]
MSDAGILDREEMIAEEMQTSRVCTDTKLKLKFDIGIIELLGDQLYTQLPAVLSEYISNSYDADATEVTIIVDVVDDGRMKTDITIKDNGIGIADEDDDKILGINNKYLKVGRKRRRVDNSSLSKIYNRKLQGKKGIGKLAGFGITKKIEISTVSDNILNTFILDYDDMHEVGADEEYFPEHTNINEPTDIYQGTSIKLCEIFRKNEIDLSSLVIGLVKRNKIFDDNFKVILIKNVNGLEEVDKIIIDNEMYLNSIKEVNQNQFEWSIPEKLEELNMDQNIINYFKDNRIIGKVWTSTTPLKKDNQGIILYANGKLCQDNSTFNERANDNFYQYMYGYLEVDFIDADIEIDNISTARDSLVWENPVSQELKNMIDEVIKKIQIDWRNLRKNDKKEELKKVVDMDIDKWLESLPKSERITASKLVNTILEDPSIDNDKAKEYIGYVKDMYSFSTFKDLAAEIVSVEDFNVTNTLKLVKDWKFIEAKELAKVSEGRIQTIDSFEKMIIEDKSERDVIQPFIEEFPWLLDPKLISFEREVTYLKLLRENCNDSKLGDESNRRIDFLTSMSDNTLYIFELKRPNLKVKTDYVTQVYDYESFIHKVNPNINVKTFLVTNNCEIERTAQSMIDSAVKTNKFEIKTYTELLSAARSYHKEIIERYQLLNKNEESN